MEKRGWKRGGRITKGKKEDIQKRKRKIYSTYRVCKKEEGKEARDRGREKKRGRETG